MRPWLLWDIAVYGCLIVAFAWLGVNVVWVLERLIT